jgi:hypothetical protein
LSEPLDGLVRVARDLVVGHAEDAFAVLFQFGLALRVVVAGDRVVVPGLAAGFEDEAVGAPAEVGDVAVGQPLVYVGRFEARLLDEVEDEVFEVASRGDGWGCWEEGGCFVWGDAVSCQGFADRSPVRFERQH